MTQYASEFLIVALPAFLICAAFWAWAAKTSIAHLATILRRSAIFWALFILFSHLFLTITTIHCGGNILYGFGECQPIPQVTPTAATLIFLAGMAIGALYGAGLLCIGVFWEWRTQRT